MKDQNLFSAKNKQNIFSLLSAEFTKRVVKVNGLDTPMLHSEVQCECECCYICILHKNLYCGASSEALRWGTSKEYQQHMVMSRNKKTIYLVVHHLELFFSSKYLLQTLVNSADNKSMIFFLFFQENRLWYFMQIVSNGDNLHEMSKPFFWKKRRKYISNCCLLKFLQSMLRVNSPSLIINTGQGTFSISGNMTFISGLISKHVHLS